MFLDANVFIYLLNTSELAEHTVAEGLAREQLTRRCITAHWMCRHAGVTASTIR